MERIDPVDRAMGQVLRHARKSMKISQSELGHGVGITFQQIQKYESGANRLSISRLFAVATYLGLEPVTLIRQVQDGIAREATAQQPSTTPDPSRDDMMEFRLSDQELTIQVPLEEAALYGGLATLLTRVHEALQNGNAIVERRE